MQLKALPIISAVIVLFAILLPLPAAESVDQDQQLTPADKIKIADSLANSLVIVEYTLKYDKGQAPDIGGWGSRCPNCGGFHSIGSGQQMITEERPLEVDGYLVADNLVITSDMMVHPRFVEKIEVRFGNHLVAAKINSYFKNQPAVLVELDQPLPDTAPLKFQPENEGPYWTLSLDQLNSLWSAGIKEFSTTLTRTETGRTFQSANTAGIVVTRDATPVAMVLNNQFSADDSWKISPRQWPAITAEQMQNHLDQLQKIADKSLLRVTLNFRSPKQSPRQSYMNDEEENPTEIHTTGILANNNQVLVLTSLKPKITARLERITVHQTSGEPIPATFAGTLTDYGALLADLETPLDSPATLIDDSIRDFDNQLLLAAEVIIQGEKRITYFKPIRLASFELGWKRQIYPNVTGDSKNLFIFDQTNRLISLPIIRREKVSEDDRFSSAGARLTATGYLKNLFTDLAANLDPSNIPLTEAEESRLAWMGIEMQALNKELARINNVSDLTKDGKTGALVSYVYPNSPAAAAGIEPGAIILRLHCDDLPKPLDIDVSGDMFIENFPWEQLDQVPEQYLDRIPQPWPSAENSLSRALTDIGFDKKYRAEFFIDGQVSQKEFTVTQSPPHFDSAARYKSEALGVTVRNLTYELLRYFQRTPDEPGVIVSKIEPGSKASVSGIKPYEIINQVNDQPVNSIEDFETLIQQQADLRIAVKRMTRGRVVKINMTDENSEPDTPENPASENEQQ